MHQKLAPDPSLILLNSQNSHCIQEILFLKRYFERGLSQYLKKLALFFLSNPLPLDKVIKNKRGLQLVTSRSSGYKTSLKIFLYF